MLVRRQRQRRWLGAADGNGHAQRDEDEDRDEHPKVEPPKVRDLRGPAPRGIERGLHLGRGEQDHCGGFSAEGGIDEFSGVCAGIEFGGVAPAISSLRPEEAPLVPSPPMLRT